MRFSYLMPCASLLASVAMAEPISESASFTMDEAANSPELAIAEGATIRHGEFSATLHGDMGLWGGYVGDDALLANGDRMQEPGFRLRRARTGLTGDLNKRFSYQLELDLYDQEHDGGPLYRAWLNFRPLAEKNFTLDAKAGLQTVPYSMAMMMAGNKLAFLARPMGTDAMAPCNAVGLALTGSFNKYAKLTLGVFNGLQRQSSFQQGYKAVGGSSGNRFEKMAYVARADVFPTGKSTGDAEPDLAKSKDFRLALGGAFLFNDGESIESTSYSGYLHAKIAGFHFFGEALFEHAEPQAKPSTTATIATEADRMALMGSLGYMILKDRLGIAARVELLDANDAYDDEQDELVIAAALTWYEIGHALKARLEYQHREERYGMSMDNDAYLAGVEFSF